MVGVDVATTSRRSAAATIASASGRSARTRAAMPARASPTATGISIRDRTSVISSSSWSDSSGTRKPLLRTTSTSPSRARSIMASRTGVGETPNRSAMAGAEYTTPERMPPLTIDARSAWAIWTRTLFLGPSEGRFGVIAR